MEFIKEVWPWYVSGPLIGFIALAMLFIGKSFGVSSTFRHICSAAGCGKEIDFFNYDWKAQKWNLFFVLGAVIGGFLSQHFLMNDDFTTGISEATINDLKTLGLTDFSGLLPQEIFSFSKLNSTVGWFILIVGGFLVGFGARYAGGCTSGHAITGLSNLQLPSLIAVVGFFIGGLLMTHFIFPYLF